MALQSGELDDVIEGRANLPPSFGGHSSAATLLLRSACAIDEQMAHHVKGRSPVERPVGLGLDAAAA